MLRIFAKFFSLVFHPLLILTYMLILLLLVNPYLFGVPNIELESRLILLMFLSTFMLPAFSVFMMSNLGLVKSIKLEDKQERIGPYIITGIFYLWMVVNFMNNARIPKPFTTFVMGATIALFVSFFINIFKKISAHAVGMGGFIGMIVLTMALFEYNSFVVNMPVIGNLQLSLNTVLMIVLILAGIVGTSRLILKAHEPKEVYLGYAVGFLCQFVGFAALA